MTALSHVQPDQAAWQQRVWLADADQLAAAHPGCDLQCEQLSPGVFSAMVHTVQLPGLRLVHQQVACAVRQRGSLGAGVYSLALPLTLGATAHFGGQALQGDTLMIGPGKGLDRCLPAHFAIIGVVVQGDLLADWWQRLYQKPLSAWLAQQVVVPTQPDVARELRAFQLRTLQTLITHPGQLDDAAAMLRLRDALLLEWLRAIAPQVDVSGLQRVAQRRQWVDQACALALADPANPPPMRVLCGHLGVSPRTLEQAFGEVLGHSPAKYLRAVRLNGARRALRQAAQQGLGVHDVAARWGFWHQGQFAGDYKRQFGELPSATLLARPAA